MKFFAKLIKAAAVVALISVAFVDTPTGGEDMKARLVLLGLATVLWLAATILRRAIAPILSVQPARK